MPKLSTLETYISTALNTVSGIKLVETDIGRFNQSNTFPVLYYSINRTGSNYISFPHATSNDQEGIAELRIFGSVKPKITKNIKSDLYTLVSNTEKAINSSATLQANVVSCLVKAEENDMDINDKFGYFEMTIEIVYLYNHLNP